MFAYNSRILFQGDSITDYGRDRKVNANSPANQGLGSSHAMMIAAELLSKYPELNLQFYNRGFCGNRIVDMYARWKADVINLKPDYISILIGVNDIWAGFSENNGVDLEHFDKIYRKLLDWTLRELPEVKFIICEPFIAIYDGGIPTEMWRNDMHLRQNAVKNIAEDYNAVFIPFQEIFDKACEKAPASYWMFDGVHPLHAGYGLMSKAWIDLVNNKEILGK